MAPHHTYPSSLSPLATTSESLLWQQRYFLREDVGCLDAVPHDQRRNTCSAELDRTNKISDSRVCGHGPSRRQRAILGFIGDLSHTLFGTATTKDVNMLQKHIQAIAEKTEQISKDFQIHTEGMSSYMKKNKWETRQCTLGNTGKSWRSSTICKRYPGINAYTSQVFCPLLTYWSPLAEQLHNL